MPFAVAKYAAFAGHTPTEFLNQYFTDNMVALFEKPRSGDLESHVGNLEYQSSWTGSARAITTNG